MAGLVASDLSDVRDLVSDWADRSDISDSVIDNFINIAMQRANRVHKIPDLEISVDINFSGVNLPLPTGAGVEFLSTKRLSVSTGSGTFTLEPKDLKFVEAINGRGSQGIPCFFFRSGSNLVVAPTPSGVTEATLQYYVEFDSLTADTDTNWYVTDGTTALLYGALKELSVYIGDEEQALLWEQQFQAAVVEIQDTYDQAEWSGDTLSIVI